MQAFFNFGVQKIHDAKMAEKAAGGSLGTLKKAIQLALGPDLETIKRDLADIKNEVKIIGARQEEMDKRLSSQIGELDLRLNSRMDEMDKRLSTQIGELDKRNTIQFESIRGDLRGLSEKVVGSKTWRSSGLKSLS
jgi:hypothetical protein